MIGEFERYHGAVIRCLIVESGVSLTVKADDDAGRVNTFLFQGSVGIHVKHSSKRLPPWQFTYPSDSLAEIERLAARSNSVWLIHVCGQDGFVALSLAEFLSINPIDADTTSFVRIDRDRNKMYRVNGTGGKLAKPKRRGLAEVCDDLRG